MLLFMMNQEQVLEFFKSKAVKTHVVDEFSLICLFENSKLIDVDLYDEDQVCLTYDETESDCESQSTHNVSEINDEFLNRLLENIDDINVRLEHYANEEHKSFLREFLKSV